MCLGHYHGRISSCDATEAGVAFAIRPRPRHTVPSVCRTLDRARLRSKGDTVRAREHALAHLSMGWFVMEHDDELSKMDEVHDFPEVPEMLEAGAWSLLVSFPWNEFDHDFACGTSVAARHACEHSPPCRPPLCLVDNLVHVLATAR